MKKINLLIFFCFLFFSNIIFSGKITKSNNITIEENLAVTGNASLLTSTNFADALIIDPLDFQGTLKINGKIYLSSNVINIGNDLSNTVLYFKNLETAPTEASLFYIMIDLDSSNLFILPLTNNTLKFKAGQNYSVNTLEINNLITNIIQSQIITSDQKAIMIGNPNSTVTLQGQTLVLNAANDITSSANNLTINADILMIDAHLEAAGNIIDNLQVQENLVGLNNMTINNQGTENSFRVNNSFTTEYGTDNTISFSAKNINCLNNTSEPITITIGTIGNTNKQIVFNNIPENQSTPTIFLVLNTNNNQIFSTQLLPKIKTCISPLLLIAQPTININEIIQCGNADSTLTLEATSIIIPNIILDQAANILKQHQDEHNDYEIKTLDYQIQELLKAIISKKDLLAKYPELKEKLNFLLEKRGNNKHE